MSKLGESQRKILNFIRYFIQNNGFPPTVREIGEAIGLRSSATVHQHLRKLELRGHLQRIPGKSRGYVVPKEKTDIFVVPLISRVSCGPNLYTANEIQGFITLPSSLASESSFVYIVPDNKYSRFGIKQGDLLVVTPFRDLSQGELSFSIFDSTPKVGRVDQGTLNKLQQAKFYGKISALIRPSP
jgi:repressor LexA